MNYKKNRRQMEEEVAFFLKIFAIKKGKKCGDLYE